MRFLFPYHFSELNSDVTDIYIQQNMCGHFNAAVNKVPVRIIKLILFCFFADFSFLCFLPEASLQEGKALAILPASRKHHNI